MRIELHRLLSRYQGSYTKEILDEAIALLAGLWPYLVMGIIFTTLIKLYLSKDSLSSFLQRNRMLSIPIASMLGVISPLGSYIIIPLSAALYTTGVPLSILMALLVASPLINPTLFLLTQGAMGIEMAVARLIAAFLLGLLAGYATSWFEKRNMIAVTLNTSTQQQMLLEDPQGEKPGMKDYFRELYRMSRYISKFFFLAILLAAVIKILTPPNLMIRIFNGNNFLSILFSTSAGIPFYVCGGASIPVVKELSDLGLSKGAVLAFFISGPITKISNLMLMFAIFKKRILYLYMAFGIIGAIICGSIFELF